MYNSIKQAYSDLIYKYKETFNDVICWPREALKITYIYYSSSNRESDLMNQLVEIDKFFCDAIVNAWIIPDDNTQYIHDVSFKYWWYWQNMMHVQCVIEKVLLPSILYMPAKSKTYKLSVWNNVWFIQDLSLFVWKIINVVNDIATVQAVNQKTKEEITKDLPINKLNKHDS
jgi:hypothetical protein